MIRGITGHTPARCSQNYTFMDSVANPEKALKYSLLDGGSRRGFMNTWAMAHSYQYVNRRSPRGFPQPLSSFPATVEAVLPSLGLDALGPGSRHAGRRGARGAAQEAGPGAAQVTVRKVARLPRVDEGATCSSLAICFLPTVALLVQTA